MPLTSAFTIPCSTFDIPLPSLQLGKRAVGSGCIFWQFTGGFAALRPQPPAALRSQLPAALRPQPRFPTTHHQPITTHERLLTTDH